MKEKNTDISIKFNFNNSYTGETESFEYFITDEQFIRGVKHLAELDGCTLSGSEAHIWNFLSTLGLLDKSSLYDIEDNEFFIEFLKNDEEVKEDAYQEFEEEIKIWYEDDDIDLE